MPKVAERTRIGRVWICRGVRRRASTKKRLRVEGGWRKRNEGQDGGGFVASQPAGGGSGNVSLASFYPSSCFLRLSGIAIPVAAGVDVGAVHRVGSGGAHLTCASPRFPSFAPAWQAQSKRARH